MTLPGRTHKDQRRHRRKVAQQDPDGKGLEEHIKRELRRGTGRKKTQVWERKPEPRPLLRYERKYAFDLDIA